MFLYKAGLSLNSDVGVPILKSKHIAKKCFSIQGWRWVGTASQSGAPVDFDWQPTISHSSLSAPVALRMFPINAPSSYSFAK